MKLYRSRVVFKPTTAFQWRVQGWLYRLEDAYLVAARRLKGKETTRFHLAAI